MDFTLSAEQLMIKDSVTRFAAEPPKGDPWTTFAELGWLALGAPEDLGGFGGPLETMILMEAFGKGLVTAPYLAQVVLAGSVLRLAARTDVLQALVDGNARFAVAYEEPHARHDPSRVATIAMRQGDGYVLGGSKVRVLGASSATSLIVSARVDTHDGEIGLFTVPVDAPGVEIHELASEDGHDVAGVGLDNVRISASGRIAEAGLPILEHALDIATAALCAEAVGIMSVLHDVTLDYLKNRTQFGVAIGSFQALQHRMAEMFTELELARSMSFVAAMTVADEADPHERARAISGAKVQIARSGRFVGQNAIQLHGAIGMTEEYKIGHYFKRMTTLERLLGDSDYHLGRYIANRRTRIPVTA
jgi:alkylation response protein AidB-like acyl-CoA dehydrogenase